MISWIRYNQILSNGSSFC